MFPKKAVFLVRDDFFIKFGGDTFQIEQYKKYFLPDVLVSEIATLSSYDESEMFKYDAIILVNIDRLYELIAFYRSLKNAGLINKVFIVTIHHARKDIELMLSKKLGSKNIFFKYLGGYLFYEKIKSIYFCLKNKKYNLLIYNVFSCYMSVIRTILSNCNVIAIASGELKSLEIDFNVKIKSYIIINNGVTEDFINKLSKHNEISRNEIDVLICGRIEPRKNQLELAKLLSGKDYSVVFAGSLSKHDLLYVKKFKEIVSLSKNISYIGSVATDEMIDLYLKSKISLSGSLCEVSSLVDVEAFSAGCYVICSKNGYSSEILAGEGVIEIDPLDPLNITQAIHQGLNELPEKKYVTRRARSWRSASRELQDFIIRRVSQ